MITDLTKLEMLPVEYLICQEKCDPIRFYYWPVIGRLYRRRVELCLAECTGGERILEVGFGSGVTFLNLNAKYNEIHGIDLTSRADAVQSTFQTRNIHTFLLNGNVLDLPYRHNLFDSVLLISILEHLKPDELEKAFREIWRVLKPGGQVVYGVPMDRPFMALMFLCLGYDIRKCHFSSEQQVSASAGKIFGNGKIVEMKSPFGSLYQVGSFVKNGASL